MKVTKKARKEQAQAIIDRNVIGIEFCDADIAEMNEVLGCDHHGYKRMRNPDFKDPRHLHVLRDGQWRAFSWNKAISPRSQTQEVKKVMRESVRSALAEFRDECYDHPCAYEHLSPCGGDMTADHVGKPFDDLADEFLRIYGEPELERAASDVGYRFVDMDLEATWFEFHQAHAVLQMVCRSHNASKGKREAPTHDKLTPFEEFVK